MRTRDEESKALMEVHQKFDAMGCHVYGWSVSSENRPAYIAVHLTIEQAQRLLANAAPAKEA